METKIYRGDIKYEVVRENEYYVVIHIQGPLVSEYRNVKKDSFLGLNDFIENL